MIDVEPLIESSFDRMLPEREMSPEWDDVLARAGVRSTRRTRLQFIYALAAAALLAAIAVSPLGAAVRHSLGDFSGWISGHPGKPASKSAAASFAAEPNWASFPEGTSVRRLISADEDGVHYVLYGFRSGAALCLRVAVSGAAEGAASSCAPLAELEKRRAPVLVLEVDHGFGAIPGQPTVSGESFARDRAAVSFGVTTDAVRGVSLRSDHGATDALLASDAFLAVSARPQVGERMRAITATDATGKMVPIPFAQAPFDASAPDATPSGNELHGPQGVERELRGGSINWVTNQVTLGSPWPTTRVGSFIRGGTLVFGRLLQPNPAIDAKIGLSLWDVAKSVPPMKPGRYICVGEFIGHGGSGGCSPVEEAFARSPVSFGVSTAYGGDQYSLLSGYASDDVEEIRLYLGTGEVVAVPLKDNVFAAEFARAKYPIRVVGYDNAGKAIANQALASENGPSGPAYLPKNGARWTKRATVPLADGTTASVFTVPSGAGGICWRLRNSDGSGGSGCRPPGWKGALRGDLLPTSGPSLFILQARPSVARVEVTYASRTTDTVSPAGGLVVYAPPTARIGASDRVISFTAYDDNGARIGVLRVGDHY